MASMAPAISAPDPLFIYYGCLLDDLKLGACGPWERVVGEVRGREGGRENMYSSMKSIKN